MLLKRWQPTQNIFKTFCSPKEKKKKRNRNILEDRLGLDQTNVILCSDKKGQVPKTQLSPSEVWILTDEADLSWWLPQGQVPRPYPAVIAEGARGPGPNWPSGSLGHPKGGGEGARSHRLHPMQTATAVWSQRQGWRRGSPLFQGLGLASGWS